MKIKTKRLKDDPMLPVINAALLWIAKDLRKKRPVLTHTLFSASEFNENAELKLSKSQEDELLVYLEQLDYVTRTDKQSPTGPYFNIHRNPFVVLHKTLKNRSFVSKLKTPQIGYCLTQTKNRTYRLTCAGRKCKFYFESEKQCIQGKFFMQ